MLRTTRFLAILKKFNANYPEDIKVQINDEFLRVSCNSQNFSNNQNILTNKNKFNRHLSVYCTLILSMRLLITYIHIVQ